MMRKEDVSNESVRRSYGDEWVRAVAVLVNLERINTFWRLHGLKWEADCGACELFAIDRRFVEGGDEWTWRLGVSFGRNPFLRNKRRGVVRSLDRRRRFAFGLHVVCTFRENLSRRSPVNETR